MNSHNPFLFIHDLIGTPREKPSWSNVNRPTVRLDDEGHFFRAPMGKRGSNKRKETKFC
jgi:hypothetical protein